jgi:hypothetical protein
MENCIVPTLSHRYSVGVHVLKVKIEEKRRRGEEKRREEKEGKGG